MDKYRQPQPFDEVAPGLDGPDYVTVVIEWDDLPDPFEDTVESGMTGAQGPGMPTSDDDPNWNRVDEASLESFPASDPPAWGSSHAVAEAAVPEPIFDEITSPFEPRVRVSGVRRIVLGLAAIVALIAMIEGLRRIRRRA